jgi:hypothetical protein
MEVLTACVHHWICDTPTGPISKSRCRLCGEEKEFNNRLGGEQAERLPYEGGAAYLPEQRQITRLEVTEEPEVEPKPKDTRCPHSWHSGDPDEQGIAHVWCTLCAHKYWVDLEGNLYDSQKNMLSYRRQGIQPGEVAGRREKGANMDTSVVPKQGRRASPQSRTAEYDRKWPEILKRLEELGNIGLMAKELGVTYASFQPLLIRRGVDVKKYMVGGSGHKKAPPAEARTPVQRIAEVAGNIKERPQDLGPVTKEDQILGMLGALQISISSLAAVVKSLQKEPPRCKFLWENGDPVFVCETREDAHRMQDALLRHTQIRQPK